MIIKILMIKKDMEKEKNIQMKIIIGEKLVDQRYPVVEYAG